MKVDLGDIFWTSVVKKTFTKGERLNLKIPWDQSKWKNDPWWLLGASYIPSEGTILGRKLNKDGTNGGYLVHPNMTGADWQRLEGNTTELSWLYNSDYDYKTNKDFGAMVLACRCGLRLCLLAMNLYVHAAGLRLPAPTRGPVKRQ